MKRVIISKISIVTQIQITTERVDILMTQRDFNLYYVHLTSYLSDMLLLVDEYINKGKIATKIIGTKIGVINNELIFKLMNNSKQLGIFIIPIKLLTSDEYLNDNSTNKRFIYTKENGEEINCFPSNHTIERFAKRYCFAVDINFDNYSGILSNMVSIFNKSSRYDNKHTHGRRKNYSQSSIYLRYNPLRANSDENSHDFCWVLNPENNEIVTFELGGKFRDFN